MGIIFNAGIFAVGPYVASFNTRTGDVVLLSQDVIDALGYVPADGADYLPLSAGPGNPLTGVLVFDGSVVNQAIIDPTSSGVNAQYVRLRNAGGEFSLGKNNSTGSVFGGTAYASVIYSTGNVPIEVFTNGGLRYSVDGVGNHNFYTGSATFGGAIIGTGASLTNVVNSFNTRTGAVTLLSADVTGALGYTPVNKAGDTMSGTLSLPNIKFTSATPGVSAGPGAGTAPTITIDGNNSSGKITITLGTAPAANDVLCTIALSGGFSYSSECLPVILVGPYNVGLVIPTGLYVTGGTNSWEIRTTTALTAGVGLNFSINYYCGGR